jgi:hypothetical protein
MAGMQQGREEVTRKLPRVDVMLVVSSVRAKRGQSGKTTVRPSGGGEQDGGAERRRSRGAKMRARESVNEVEEGSWTCCGNKKGHGQAGAAAGDRRRDVAASGDDGTMWRGGGKPAEVGRAAGGRAGGPGSGVRAAKGSWQCGESPARGGGVAEPIRLNYSGSSALVITIQAILTQRTSNGTTRWSVGSPPDSTTVTQDRGRFTSHEGEFTITPQLTNF